jgi:hypothetical protein
MQVLYLTPSLGKGADDREVAGRGYFTTVHVQQSHPSALPLGGNRTVPALFYLTHKPLHEDRAAYVLTLIVRVIDDVFNREGDQSFAFVVKR